jgi:diguanylate cyclase (GGDEF)-like protein
VQQMEALKALARLAVAETADSVAALSDAAHIAGAAIASGDVRVFVGDGTTNTIYPRRADEDFFGLSAGGAMALSQGLRSLSGAAVFVIGRNGLPDDIAPADGSRSASYLGLTLWIGDAYGGTLVAHGQWAAGDVRRAGQFLDAAGPALSVALERVVDADRVGRVQRQIDGLANIARVFDRTANLREVLANLVNAINSATGLLSSIDVFGTRGRIVLRSTAASRYTGTPLYQAWLDMVRGPDPIRKMILKDQQPVFLPDLQNDPRISEAARQFYRRASLVSAATFPLLVQDEVVGLLRVGSLKPGAFDRRTADLLNNLALQSAVVVKGVQLWEQLERSRRKAERYGEKLAAMNEELREEITERERAEDALRQNEEVLKYLADHDALTGLPNRALLKDRLATALAQRRRDRRPLAVLYLDLDNFKVVNDMTGHAEGDRVLTGVAERLISALREGDTVARIGGDEFTVLLPAVSGVEDAHEIAQRVLERLRRPWKLAGNEFMTTASLGIAMFPQDGEEAETLIRNADTAMYQAKAATRDSACFFAPEMDTRMRDRMALEADLRQALIRGEMVVHYQPQVSTDTGEIVGMEALVRWQHPDRGTVYPDAFIPLAEETGLILPLGEWVLRTACAQNKAFQDVGLPPVRVAVNLSTRQFAEVGLAGTVASILKETGLAPDYLDLEITEGTAMRDVEFSVKTLSELRRMGVHVSIDDFGTGYSSLAYLKRLPIDSVKIDRSFVSDPSGDAEDAAIVSAIIVLAQTLNLKTVAEGVETEQQLANMKRQQCDEIQGYLFGEAVEGLVMAQMLAEGSPRSFKQRRARARKVA